MALTISEAILHPIREVWHNPLSCTPTAKRVEHRYFVTSKGVDFLFSHPAPALLVVDTATEWAGQHCSTFIPSDRAAKCLDLLRYKLYSSVTLQFRILNYQALLARYDFNNYAKLGEFLEDISQDE